MVATSKLYVDRSKTEKPDILESAAFPSVGSWRFPRQLAEFYRSVGVSSLFKWQIGCLSLPDVLDGRKNLIFAAPTSAGKTLVAEILMWKRLTESKQKAIYIVPFVSVGREKVIYLQSLFKTIGLKIDAYIGSQNSMAGIHSWDVAVCTIEKANNLINRCIEENNLDLIGTIVIDEFHIIGDPQRGYLVELLVTKVLQMCRLKQINIQIVAMSATISNLSSLARWMDSLEYVTDFRPVALSEQLYTEGSFCNRNMEKMRSLPADYVLSGDQDNIVGLCLETVIDGFGVLVFCATKSWCEKLSETIATMFGKVVKKCLAASLSDKLRMVLDSASITNFMNDYKRIVGIVDPVLALTLKYGVAFHHAGLTMEERDQLERGFRAGVIRVLVATSTLSSGVNLPARRVIIRSPWGHAGATTGPSLTHAAYKQMVGRAGRKGIDSEGESVIICKRQEVKRGLDLMNGKLESVESALVNKPQLTGNKNSAGASIRVKRAVLEAVVGHFATSIDDVITYVNCTLMAAELVEQAKDVGVIRTFVDDCVNYLVTQQFVVLENDSLTATQLGRATLASAMNPEEAWFMFQDLKQAQRSLVLDNELHMVYLVTPTYMQDQWGSDFDWFGYHRIWCRLTDEQRRISDLVGVSEAFIIMSTRRQGARPNGSNEARRYGIHMRFYTAMALYELIEEVPISQVAEKFGCTRGFLQALQQQASTYAGMAIAFCDRLGWWYMKTLLSGFAERIAFGVRRELTELVQIDGMDGSRARCFHHSGFTTLANLVYAKPLEIAAALRKAVPFKDENENRTLKRCWLSGHPEMNEDQAVALLQSRANAILEENLSRFGISLVKCGSGTLAKEIPTPPDVSPANNECQEAVTAGLISSEPAAVIPEAETKATTNLDDQTINGVDQASPSVEFLNQVNLMNQINAAVMETIPTPEPATPKVKLQQPQPEFDDELDEILMNMSRFSLTPRSGDVTPASANKATPAGKTPFDYELTDSQFSKLLDDSAMASPLLRTGKKTAATTDSPIPHDNAHNVTPMVLNGKFLSQDLPASLSKAEVDAIRDRSDGEMVLNSSDVDLFDDCGTADMSTTSGEDGEEQVKSDRPPSPLSNDSSESGIETTSSSQLRDHLAQPDFRTPVSQIRKRQRVLRDSSENSTPSPLVRKYSKFAEVETYRMEQLDPIGASQSLFGEPGQELITDNEPIIVDTCTNFETFSKFASDWRAQKRFAIAFGERKSGNDGKGRSRVDKDNEMGKSEVIGVAVCWTVGLAYWISLEEDIQDASNSSEPAVTRKERLRLIKRCLCAKTAESNDKIIFDSLHTQRLAKLLFPDCLSGSIFCLRVADWLISCGNEDTPPVNTVTELITRYSRISTLSNCPTDNGTRICNETMALFSIWLDMEDRLKQRNLWNSFVETEMPAIKVVSEMETNGISLNLSTCRNVCDRIKKHQSDLERKAHQLAGRTFSLNSYSELAKILFVELKLPADGASMVQKRNHGAKRHYSTSKDVLEKLRPMHLLPGVILDWRKLHSALTSAIFPLLKGSWSTEEGMKRIFGTYDWYTATGRVIMHEPSLQVIPRTFDITDQDGITDVINVRNLIGAEPGHVFLSADYSQLELRILAHLSQDEKLLQILNSDDGDVFRIIASAWLGLPLGNIDGEQRQRAKKLCYGIVYGMGPKTLAEELEVSEETAIGFMDSFKAQFPGVFVWMENVIASTRETGYVKTLNGRMRCLPAIRFSARNVLDQRHQAERQAVNTSVQGSAADIFKSALRDVSSSLKKRFSTAGSSCRFVLQLHDELIVEVKETIADQVAEIVRRQMEKCYQLRVQLRVRLTKGKTWGDMKVLDL